MAALRELKFGTVCSWGRGGADIPTTPSRHTRWRQRSTSISTTSSVEMPLHSQYQHLKESAIPYGMNDAGDIDFDMMMSMLPDNLKEAASRVAVACKELAGADAAEKAYSFNQCFYKAEPSVS
uniref:(California timema) hypothetical protein n=1 Tax=Timema californicum TaxID=61474 RepID=A0A7R9PA06_TIMCA|nr:unnamed protein product [Timema californicum]